MPAIFICCCNFFSKNTKKWSYVHYHVRAHYNMRLLQGSLNVGLFYENPISTITFFYRF